uniref:Putative secreted peptide n=1 Tax=Anopheles braziliensis TaxID=58242 RepID=A0A2M3ZTH0_9DIPT
MLISLSLLFEFVNTLYYRFGDIRHKRYMRSLLFCKPYVFLHNCKYDLLRHKMFFFSNSSGMLHQTLHVHVAGKTRNIFHKPATNPYSVDECTKLN